ncbi:MAG TPA: hypothetical protein VHT96_13900 [Clostridia bacterium]|nr:hypothetical protein [Clostridia bacterium]
MKQTYLCAFDIGVSFDINDDIFKENSESIRKEKIINLEGVKINYPSKEIPYGIHLSIGAGLGIDLSSTYIKDKWADYAKENVSDAAITKYSTCSREKLGELFNIIEVDRIYLTVYSIGAAYLTIDIGSIDESRYSDCFIDLYRCFEYAAYYHISEDIKKIIVEFISYFKSSSKSGKHASSGTIFNACRRFDIREFKGTDIFPGFTCINVCLEESHLQEVLQAVQIYEAPNSHACIRTDDAVIYLGWASAVVNVSGVRNKFDRENIDRTLLLFEIVWVFWTIAEAYEKLFTLKAMDMLKSRTNDKVLYSVKEIGLLKSLTNIVIQLTTYAGVTIDITSMKFMEAFEELGHIYDKHSRLRDASSTFIDTQNEMIEEDRRKKEGLLNKFVLVITSLTFVSVASDVIGSFDYDNSIISRVIRIIILSLSLLAGLMGVRFFTDNKDRKKQRDV